MNHITEDQRQQMIKGYNALVEDYLSLNIGHMPFIEEASNIDVEALFVFQGLITTELINHARKGINSDEIRLQRLSKGFRKGRKSNSTAKIKSIL